MRPRLTGVRFAGDAKAGKDGDVGFGGYEIPLTGKLADTTGMSKNAIPMLAKHGVKAFHIGYNGVGGLPDVNSTFVWKHQQTGTELLMMIEDDYGKEIDVPASSMRASIVKGGGQQEIALVFLYTVDNTGPPSAEQVTTFWEGLRAKHPSAVIEASSLDAFVSEVLAGDTGELQTVTEELGDSWL